jgi:hypothetical protein
MRKVIKKRLDHEAEGLKVVADVDAVIAVNSGDGSTSEATSVSRQRVVQRSRRRPPTRGAAKREKEEQ